MKKLIAMLLALTMVLALAACTAEPANTPDPETTAATDPVESEPVETDPVESEPAAQVMTYEEFMAAEVDQIVTIESYVQATQGWWDNTIVIYLQGPDGAYFSYGTKCSEEDAAKLVPGTKIRITGTKAEFNGEIEVMDGEFEFIDGAEAYIAEPMDVTALLGTEELAQHMNKKVSIKGATVAAANDEGAAFLYKWDGSGKAGDDLYFNVTVGEQTYNFCVESYLTGDGSEVYEAVESWKVGDVVEYGGLLGYCPIVPVKNQFSSEAFIARGGRIPAPVRSLTN